MKKYVLALDLGTTGNRAILFDSRQRIIRKSYQEFRQIFPKPGWVEHDPVEIWKSTLAVIRKTISGIDPEQIAAVGITNQRETAVVWDRKTGKPVCHAIVWQCRRTQRECEALKKRGLARMIKHKTGLTIDPYFSATKVKWILDHVAGAKQKARRGRLLFGTVDSWIVWNLTGGLVHATDYSNASRTMLLNIRTLKWDSALCRLFGVPKSMLPKLVDTSGKIGVTSRRIIGAEIPIAGVVGDQQGAMFAQGCYTPGVVKNTYGTGLFLQVNTKRKIPASRNLLNTIAWKIGRETDYALEGSVFIGGAALQWLRDGLGIIKSAPESLQLAQQLKSNDGVYFVPAFVGLGAPYWDSSARGLVIGVTRGTGRAHFARAALESIAYQTKDVVRAMEADLKTPVKKLQVDGGAVQNDFLMQFQADLLGCPVERPRVIETTALGAAGLAGIAVGFWKNRKEFLSHRRVERTFRPSLAVKTREALYAKWQDAVRRALAWER